MSRQIESAEKIFYSVLKTLAWKLIFVSTITYYSSCETVNLPVHEKLIQLLLKVWLFEKNYCIRNLSFEKACHIDIISSETLNRRDK